LANEVMKNRMIHQQVSEIQPIVIDAKPNSVHFEAELDRMRAELNE
jgi:hypothetical protein